MTQKKDSRGAKVDFSRVGEKNPDMVKKFHALSQRKAEIQGQIKRSTSPDQKTSLTLELDRVEKKIKNFWLPGSGYKD